MYTHNNEQISRVQPSFYLYGVCVLVAWLTLPMLVFAAEVDDALEFFPGAQVSNQIWVSPSGNDSAAGTASAPKRTVQAAINAATAGTAIMVKSGTYRESLVIDKSSSAGRAALGNLTATRPLLLVSADGFGNARIEATKTNDEAILVNFVSHVGIHGFQLHHGLFRSYGQDGDTSIVKVVGSRSTNGPKNVVVSRNRFTGSANDCLKFTGIHSIKAIGNVLSCTANQDTMDWVTVWDSVASYNTFTGVTNNAFTQKGGSQNNLVSYNHITVSGTPGLKIGGSGQSLSYDELEPRFRDAMAKNVIVEYNVIETRNRVDRNNSNYQTYLGALWIQGGQNNIIRNNFISSEDTQYAIVHRQGDGEGNLLNSGNNRIENNIYTAETFEWVQPDLSDADKVRQQAGNVVRNNRRGNRADVNWSYGADVAVSTITGGGTQTPTPAIPATINFCGDYESPTTPTGYGSAFNHFSGEREVIVNASCGGSGFTPYAGSDNISPQDFAVYNQGYYWSGTAWRPFTFSPITDISRYSTNSNAWILGDAIANQVPYQGATTYFVAYTCHFGPGQTPKCGCSDSTCATPKWQVQKVSRPVAR